MDTEPQRSRFAANLGPTVDELFTEYSVAAPISDTPPVAPGTAAERKRIWSAWIDFCQHRAEVDPLQFWVDFVRDPTNQKCQAAAQVFLHVYVLQSRRLQLSLGPEEVEEAQTVTTTRSVIEIWRRLTAAADFEVLRTKRQELRLSGKINEASQLSLRWEQTGSSRESPAFVIARWIVKVLEPKFGLTPTSSYKNVEATAEDVLTIIMTVWNQADLIPCDPITRVSFTQTFLLCALCGFRPGQVMNLRFRQYSLALVRDASRSTGYKPAVNATIYRNKIKERAKTSTLKFQDSISVPVTTTPCPVVDLASIVCGRAIESGALQVPFQSGQDLLHWPRLGSVDRVELQWKDEWLDREMFPISYGTLNELWHQTLAVMGCRDPIRPYALRVGSGARLDDALTGSLRNFIMSNTPDVFGSFYQTHRLRPDLTRVAFGPRLAGENSALFEDLRKMSLNRDAGAPLSITKEQRAAFEKRRDITLLRAEIDSACDAPTRARLRRKLHYTTARLEKKQLAENRKRYFQEADKSRANRVEPEACNEGGGPGEAAPVALFMRRDLPDGDTTADFISAIAQYLTPSPAREAHLAGNVNKRTAAEGSATPLTSRCFLCQRFFAGRAGLTRHFRVLHLADGTFDGPVSCSSCRRVGSEEVFFYSATEWCNHVERTHGVANSPSINPGTRSRDRPSASRTHCPFCPSSSLLSTASLLVHLNRTHVPRLHTQRFPCPLCVRPDETSLMSFWEWLVHFQTKHARPCDLGLPCPECGHLCMEMSGLRRHFTTKHKDLVAEPFECRACRAAGKPNCRVLGSAGLSLHMRLKHLPRLKQTQSIFPTAGRGNGKMARADERADDEDMAPVPCPQGQCPVMCQEDEGLRHHLEDIHNIPKPRTGQRQEGCLERTPEIVAEGPNAAQEARAASPTMGPVSDYNPDALDSFDLTNALPEDIRQNPPGLSHMESEDVSKSITPHSSLFGQGLEATFPNGWQSSISTPSWVSDSDTAYEVDSFLKTAEQSRSEDIPNMTVPVAATQSIVPMELIHPDLRDNSVLPGSEEAFPYKLVDGEGEACAPTAIDFEENIWEVERLLARWKRGRKVWYLVKWKDFPDTDNTWEKQSDISNKLVDKFDEAYFQYGGNHFGIELLGKRTRQGRSEYLVRWKGRPKSEDSWEKESTISQERVKEFEVSMGN